MNQKYRLYIWKPLFKSLMMRKCGQVKEHKKLEKRAKHIHCGVFMNK